MQLTVKPLQALLFRRLWIEVMDRVNCETNRALTDDNKIVFTIHWEVWIKSREQY
jgi:hypothetical protein